MKASPILSGDFDNKFNIPIVIEEAHHEIHEGDSYAVGYGASSAGFTICFKTPELPKEMHLVASWASESSATASLWEGREWDASSGALITIQNRARNSSNTSLVREDQSTGLFIANSSMILTPDNVGLGGNAVGVEIQKWETWATKQVGAGARAEAEWILKGDELYVIEVISTDGIKGFHINISWYEHTTE